MLSDTKTFGFSSLDEAKVYAAYVHGLGYESVHVYGELEHIDSNVGVPADTKFLVVATSKPFSKFTDQDLGA